LAERDERAEARLRAALRGSGAAELLGALIAVVSIRRDSLQPKT